MIQPDVSSLLMFMLSYGIWVFLCVKLPNDWLRSWRNYGFFDASAGPVARAIGILLLTLPLLFWLWMVLGWEPAPEDWSDFHQVSVCADSEGRLNPTQEARRIQAALVHIEDLPLGQARRVLEDALRTLQQLHKEADAQASCIDTLRLRARGYLQQADQARRWRDAVGAVSEQQTEALELMLSQTVGDASNQSFWLGVFVSFPIGLLTSIIGGLILRGLRGLARPPNA